MSQPVNIVCPGCHTTNRVGQAGKIQAAKCGRCKNPLFTGKPVDLDATSFHKHIRNNDIPVVVDFWAPWCGPCKMMAPAFTQATRQLEPGYRLAKLNTETAQAVSAELGIRSIPTMIMFYRGKEVARTSGAMDANGLVSWIQNQRAA